MKRTAKYLYPLCLLLMGGFSVAASDQETLKPPDCSKLSPSECTKKSLEWSAALAKARDAGDGWSVGCSKDRVTLEWTCFATKAFGGSGQWQLRVQHSHATGYCFSGALNDYPGRTATIRIGKNEPVSYENTLICGSTAQHIIDQLMTEVDGATRGYVWPNKTSEFEFNSKGFPAAFDKLKQRVENPQP